jgi:hypothetical protein
MKKRSLVLALLCGLAASSICTASITNVVWDGYSGGMSNCYPVWRTSGPGNYIGANVWGIQSGVAGIGMDLYTSDPTDPNFSQTIDVVNNSGFAWTGYLVDISMNNTFTISNAIVNLPLGWGVAVTQPGAPVLGVYTGHIVYTGGAAVEIDGHFNFGYDVGFAGGPIINFSQVLTPVPEPGSFSLFAMSGLLAGGLRVARRLRQKACR